VAAICDALNAGQGEMMSEHDLQVRLLLWADTYKDDYPELELLHAIPNGGYRAKATAIKLKAEGVKKGVPDLCLPVARGGYHGLYIEMKYDRNDLSPEQRQWFYRLRQQGYFCTACWAWETAADTLEHYLKGEIVKPPADGLRL
jgi:hypothetical protein